MNEQLSKAIKDGIECPFCDGGHIVVEFNKHHEPMNVFCNNCCRDLNIKYISQPFKIDSISNDIEGFGNLIEYKPDTYRTSKYALFAGRAESLLRRWANFRKDNPEMPNIDALCVRGFLQEVNDRFTENLLMKEDEK